MNKFNYYWKDEESYRIASLGLDLILDRMNRHQDNEDYYNDGVDLSPCKLTPAQAKTLLESFGWKKVDHSHNGWDCDNWIYFTHELKGYSLCLYYCGYTFTIRLSIADMPVLEE